MTSEDYALAQSLAVERESKDLISDALVGKTERGAGAGILGKLASGIYASRKPTFRCRRFSETGRSVRRVLGDRVAAAPLSRRRPLKRRRGVSDRCPPMGGR